MQTINTHTVNIYNTYLPGEHGEQIMEILNQQTLKLNTIMAQIDELQAGEDAVKASVDALQAQLAVLTQAQADALAAAQATITSLNGVITDLQAQLADGGTPAQRQALIDELAAIKAEVEATLPVAPAAPAS